MPHPAKTWHNEMMAKIAVGALKRNNIGASYAADSAEACKQILALIPENATVGFGGSMTLGEVGLLDQLKAGPYRLINPPWLEASVQGAERVALRKQSTSADVFLAGTSAVTLDGKLVNIDATGNRLAGLTFGPKKAIAVIGANKVCRTLDDALDRAKHVAGPANAKRLNRDTPCVGRGECADCDSRDRICNITQIIHKRPGAIDLQVVIVGEDLGF
jgi:L-lactate utilization protein LutB